MGLSPNIQRKSTFKLKKCSICGQSFGPESFAPTKSLFYPDGVIPVCNSCIESILVKNDYDWNTVDKLCQLADIPFVPKEWERLKEMQQDDVFYRYANIFLSSEYEGLGWGEYYQAFLTLKKQNQLEEELPELDEAHRKQLRQKWQGNYDDEALHYLEDLLNGLLATQNVNGKLQLDQAIKICKMSYEIDRRIADGDEFDKLLSSYDKLVKTAEFTPKNTKNINDFDSFGEAAKYMEKCGWRNHFYDGATRDVVDETLKNYQAFVQRLYTEETGIPEEIQRRCEAIKNTAEMENYYDTKVESDSEQYILDGYNELFGNEEEQEEFKVDLDDEVDF